jgi:hypothetical protein
MVTTLDIGFASDRDARSLAEGRFPDAILGAERARCPRAVSQTAPGRLREPARLALRPTREELAARGSDGKGKSQCRRDPMKRGPGAEPSLKTWRAPRWSAERRARPMRTRAATARTDGNAWMCGADIVGCAVRRSASLLCSGGFLALACAKLGCDSIARPRLLFARPSGRAPPARRCHCNVIILHFLMPLEPFESARRPLP